MPEPVGKDAKKTLDSWRKLAGFAPKTLQKTTLAKVQIPKIKLHVAIAKLDKDVKGLSKELRKTLDKHNRDVADLARSWVKEIDASMKGNIPVEEIASRKTMLLEVGIKVRKGFMNSAGDIQVLAKKAIVVSNNCESLKSEIRKAEKQFKKAQKKKQAKDQKMNLKVLGKQVNVGDEELKVLKSQAETVQKSMNKLSDELYKEWKALGVGAVKQTDAFTNKIRSFKVK